MKSQKPSSPLSVISALLVNKETAVDAWFEKRWSTLKPLPYFSCDLRHSLAKLAVVDTNIFPAGFNNLCNAFSRETITAFKNYFNTYHPQVKKIALLAQSHTRNKFYLMNVCKLKQLLTEAGLECRVTMLLDHYPDESFTITLDDSYRLELYRPDTNSSHFSLGHGFHPDIILSNNDFSNGVPAALQKTTVPIVPNPRLGWHRRRKNDHFAILADLTNDLAQTFAFDPWLIMAHTQKIEITDSENSATLAKAVDGVISQVQKKYEQYGITEQPYVFIKSDSGTYGMGIITANSGEEVAKLNRKKRAKLFSSKAGNAIESFIIQEGIPTLDTYSDYPIEPVIYGVGKQPIGGFFRIHESKNRYESLNAPGMSFSCLCLHKLDEPHESEFIDCTAKRDLIVCAKFLSRLAALAAAIECHMLTINH